jgi:hypothetical protein
MSVVGRNSRYVHEDFDRCYRAVQSKDPRFDGWLSPRCSYPDFAPAMLATISAAFGIITGTIGVMVDLRPWRHARDFLFGGLWFLVHDHCALIV